MSVEKSKDIMNSLFEQLDNKDADELEEANKRSVMEELNSDLAFNK